MVDFPRKDQATPDRAVSQPQRATGNRFGGQESRGAQKPLPPPPDDGKTLNVQPRPPRWPVPLSDPKYIDNAIKSVSLSGSGYVLHWNDAKGIEYSSTVPDGWIVRVHDRATFINSAMVYKTRQQAIEGLTPKILQGGGGLTQYIGLWSNDQFPFVVPTMFSDVSTPKIMAAIEAKDEQMRRAAVQTEGEMKGVAIGLLESRALQSIYQGVQNPRLYNRADRPVTSPSRPSTSSGRPTSRTPPPQAGSTSATSAPQRGTTSGTGPPASGAAAKTPTPQASPAQRSTTLASRATPAPASAPPSGPPPGVRESKGANLMPASYQSASASTPRSVITAVRADVAESQTYMAALMRGEIGLQRPSGSNLSGPDFITARLNPQTGIVEVVVTDVKALTVGKFPTPATQMPTTWTAEAQAAVAPGRL